MALSLLLAAAFSGADDKGGRLGTTAALHVTPDATAQAQLKYRLFVPGVASNPEPQAPQPGGRPLTYTHYDFAEPGPFYNLDMYFTWEDVPEGGYVYPAFQFAFQGFVGGGYMGPQIYGSGRGAHFSIWDDREGSGSAQPRTSSCERFTHEGSGTMCHVDYTWLEGREYRLRLSAGERDSSGESWVGAIQDTVTGAETQIGTIHLANMPGRVGYGMLESWGHTFMEYFGGSTTCSGQPYSRVRWRGPYADSSSALASSAVASNATCTFSNVTSTGRPQVTHEAGANTRRTTPEQAELW